MEYYPHHSLEDIIVDSHIRCNGSRSSCRHSPICVFIVNKAFICHLWIRFKVFSNKNTRKVAREEVHPFTCSCCIPPIITCSNFCIPLLASSIFATSFIPPRYTCNLKWITAIRTLDSDGFQFFVIFFVAMEPHFQ